MAHTEQWIPYVTDLGEGPASIMIDMGLVEVAPDAARPVLVMASVQFNEPGENGLGEEPEIEAIDKVLDGVIDSIKRSCNGIFALTVRTAGRMDAAVYVGTEQAAAAEQMLAMAITPLGGDTLKQDDPDWRLFHELMPEERDIRRAMEMRVLQQLMNAGDKMEKPRPIEHTLLLPGREAANQAKKSLERKGFTVVNETNDPNEELPIRLTIQRVDPATPEHIMELSDQIFELTTDLDGEYDGWQSPIVRG